MMVNNNGSLGTIICINQQVKDGERRLIEFSLENRNREVKKIGEQKLVKNVPSGGDTMLIIHGQ